MYNANLEQSGIHPNVEHAKKRGWGGCQIYLKAEKR